MCPATQGDTAPRGTSPAVVSYSRSYTKASSYDTTEKHAYTHSCTPSLETNYRKGLCSHHEETWYSLCLSTSTAAILHVLLYINGGDKGTNVQHGIKQPPWPRALSALLQAFPKGPGTLRLMRTNHAAGEEYDKGEIALFERKTCVVGGVACSEHMSKISTRCYCY